MNCKEYKNKIEKYFTDNLSTDEKFQLKNHISNCQKCAEEIKIYENLFSVLNTLPVENLPDGFSYELHNMLISADRKNFLLLLPKISYPLKYALAAAAVFIIVLLSYSTTNLYHWTQKKENIAYEKIKKHHPVVEKQKKNLQKQEGVKNIAIKENIASNYDIKKRTFSRQKTKNLPSYEIEKKVADKVLRIDISSPVYLKNIKVKITGDKNTIFVDEENKIIAKNIITKENLEGMSNTLLLPVIFKSAKDSKITLEFFENETEVFAKYNYNVIPAKNENIQCELAENDTQGIFLTYLADKNFSEQKTTELKDNKYQITVSVQTGELCFLPLNIENAQFLPNIEGKVEILYASGFSYDITDMQMTVF